MKTLGNTLLTASVPAVLAAVWAPGAWWQRTITAIVLLFAGAACAGTAQQREEAARESGEKGRDGTGGRNEASDPGASGYPTSPRPSYGRKDEK